MQKAYDVYYLEDAANSLGELFDYMINYLDMDGNQVFNMFSHSVVGINFGQGNPAYIAGHTGIELAMMMIYDVKGYWEDAPYIWSDDKSKEYWAGWAIAQYQWEKNIRFEDIINGGLYASDVIDMYLLHEADISVFISRCDSIISNKSSKNSALRRLREYHRLTQKKLSEKSGVSLRMIQLYEQGQNDISKAQVNIILKLAKTLDCGIEDLL